jgi:His-Xaa-Ser system protein HxsD
MAVMNGCSITFQQAVYGLDAVKRAAYRFADRCHVEIELSAEGIVCQLAPRSMQTDAQIELLKSDFASEVLDQDLRISIAKETEPYRNLILSLAFSKTGLPSE